MRGYVAAGVAGIMLEDQLTPKRCGHTAGKGWAKITPTRQGIPVEPDHQRLAI
jgi:2-methylisocitrate lyase-like PEP mutase family enzyme